MKAFLLKHKISVLIALYAFYLAFVFTKFMGVECVKSGAILEIGLIKIHRCYTFR